MKSHFPVWQTVCRSIATKYRAHQPALQASRWQCSGDSHSAPNATRMLHQLANRTVLVLGDSHALNLWCALTCWFASDQSVVTGTAVEAGPTGLPVLRMHATVGSVRRQHGTSPPAAFWAMPRCYSAKSNRCGESMAMVHNTETCDHGFLQRLAAGPAAQGHRFVVLYNPCGVYRHSLLYNVGTSWTRSISLHELAATDDPQRIWRSLVSAPRGGGLWHGPYNASVRHAAALLRQLADATDGGVGVLVETQPAHFPEVRLPALACVVSGPSWSVAVFFTEALRRRNHLLGCRRTDSLPGPHTPPRPLLARLPPAGAEHPQHAAP